MFFITFIIILLFYIIIAYFVIALEVLDLPAVLYFYKLDDILSRASHAVTLQSNKMWVFAGISTIKSYNLRHKETLNRVLK